LQHGALRSNENWRVVLLSIVPAVNRRSWLLTHDDRHAFEPKYGVLASM